MITEKFIVYSIRGILSLIFSGLVMVTELVYSTVHCLEIKFIDYYLEQFKLKFYN